MCPFRSLIYLTVTLNCIHSLLLSYCYQSLKSEKFDLRSLLLDQVTYVKDQTPTLTTQHRMSLWYQI